MNLKDAIIKNRVDVKELENGDYLYCLLDENEVVYVGRSMKRYPNLANHKDKTFTHISVFTCDSVGYHGNSEDLYYHLIFSYIPRYNTTLQNNSRYMSKGMMKKALDVTGVEINRWIRKNNAQPVFREYYDVKEVFKD